MSDRKIKSNFCVTIELISHGQYFEEYCLDGTMKTEKYFNVLEIPLPGFTKDSKEEEKNALSTWISHFSKNFFGEFVCFK